MQTDNIFISPPIIFRVAVHGIGTCLSHIVRTETASETIRQYFPRESMTAKPVAISKTFQ